MVTQNGKPLVAITGASSGIGAAAAKAFSHQGHPLLLMARRLERLQELGLPNTINAEVDVTDGDRMEEAIKKAEKSFGPIDCLVNNAGVMLLGQVASQNPDEWRKMFEVNVMGLLTGIRLVINGMLERNHGTVINVSSVAGRKTFPNHAIYCGTKFSVHAITEAIREEVSGSDVRFITIAPGAVETELLSHTTSEGIKAGYDDWKKKMGGVLLAEDIANAIVYAYSQPQRVCVREIVLAPTRQAP